MKKIYTFSLTSFIIIVCIFISCKKSTANQGNGVFTVTTVGAGATDSTSINATGEISHLNGGTISQEGFVWSTGSQGANPTLANQHVAAQYSFEEFHATITGLTPHTTYKVCAYGQSGTVTWYGDEILVTTP